VADFTITASGDHHGYSEFAVWNKGSPDEGAVGVAE
jgi:hypothetical protein